MIEVMTDGELAAKRPGSTFVFDIESYPNYWLLGLLDLDSGKYLFFESTDESPLDRVKLEFCLWRFRFVGFNSAKYDMPMIAIALSDRNCSDCYMAGQVIIDLNLNQWAAEKEFNVKIPKIMHVDLYEVVPLEGSLKMRMAQMHFTTIRDLPYEVGKHLTPAEIAEVRLYNVNDLRGTAALFHELSEQLELRAKMSEAFGVDLMSKSDAQIAEAVIGSRLARMKGKWPQKGAKMAGKHVRYTPPPWLAFQDPKLNQLREEIAGQLFVVGSNGAVECPGWLESEPVRIGRGVYRMGIGGLHSSEERMAFKSDAEGQLYDRDVASYYPAIILNLGLYPPQLGPEFLEVYRGIVNERLEAKRGGDKAKADSLKIVVNGSFGKFGDQWSILYSPQLLIQTTITGQLALLMLIEALELNGIRVVSANTDGIVFKCPQAREPNYAAVIQWWEGVTAFQTEETKYHSIFSRDVNNYVAIKPDGKAKLKGTYANPWSEKKSVERFKKNPWAQVCVEALVAFLYDRTPLEETIRACQNPSSFALVRKVTGGALSPEGVALGRVVRWIWSTESAGPLRYVLSNKKVADSDGAREILELPAVVPHDVDFAEYIRRSRAMLEDVGFYYARQLKLD